MSALLPSDILSSCFLDGDAEAESESYLPGATASLQGSNLDILHFRQTLSHLSHQGTVYKLGVLCPFAPMLWRPPDHYPSPPFSLLPQGQRRARLQGQCCEDCVSPAGSCSHRGLVRYQDDMWKASACEFCMCDRGQVICQTAECAKVECARVRNAGISVWT